MHPSQVQVLENAFKAIEEAAVSSSFADANQRNQLPEIELYLELLEESRLYIQRRLHGLTSKEARRRNRHYLIPLTVIPNNILVQVFKFVIEADPEEALFRWKITSNTLRLVSSHWKDVIEAHPPLWSYISTHTPSAFVQKALAKAGDAGLDISAEVYVHGHAHPAPHPYNMLKSIFLPVSHLWRRADILLVGITEKIAHEILHAPVPMLSELSLNCGGIQYSLTKDGKQIIPRIHLFNGDTPRLRHLSLKYPTLHWGSSFPKGLRTLELEVHPSLSAPSLQEFLDILRSCPDLDWLVFKGNLTASNGSVAAAASLPKLIHLDLSPPHGLPSTAGDIIRYIKAPECRSAMLDLGCRKACGIVDLDTLRVALPKVCARVESARRVVYGPHTLKLYSPDGDFILGARMANNEHIPLVHYAWLGHVTRPIRGSALHLAIEAGGLLPRSKVIRFLKAFPDVVSLSFSGVAAVGEFLQVLEIGSTGGVPVCLLPNLVRISVKQCEIKLQLVLGMLRNRYKGSRREHPWADLELLDVDEVQLHDLKIAEGIKVLLRSDVFHYKMVENGIPEQEERPFRSRLVLPDDIGRSASASGGSMEDSLPAQGRLLRFSSRTLQRLRETIRGRLPCRFRRSTPA